MSNTSIWPIDRTLSGTTTPGLSRPGSDGNEEVFYNSQSSSITGALPLDFLCDIQDSSWQGMQQKSYDSKLLLRNHDTLISKYEITLNGLRCC